MNGPPGARDRHARSIPQATKGAPSLLLPGSRSAVVIGAGLAGVAAAVVLAERGVKVEMHEAGPVLGGRVSSWPDLVGGHDVSMERGFHAFFRQYYNVRALLRRVDPALRSLRAIDDYPLLGLDGASESFAGLPRRPPLNLAALIKRTPTLGLRDLRAMDGKVAAEMLAFDGDVTYERYDAMSAAEFLDDVGFPTDARRMLFEVFAHSFFNPEQSMSAAEMLMMFHLYFLGTSEGLLFDVLDETFDDALWRPLRRYLENRGVVIHTGSAIVTWTDPERIDGLVLALPVRPLQKVVAANPWLGTASWRDDVSALQPAPPFAVWRLWLDRPVRAERAPFAGTAGIGVIDNISVVDRYQGEAHRWALRTGGAVIELHAYALAPEYANDDARTKQELLGSLHLLYPETRTARILDDRYLVRDDCPGFAPGSWARRPGVLVPMPKESLLPTVALAGDVVKLPFPTALMERAVASGFMAANHLLGQWGVQPERVWSIRPTGLLARFQHRS